MYGKDAQMPKLSGYSSDQFRMAQEADVRQPEITHQIECLERTIKGCYQGMDTLRDRLNPVTRAEGPSAVGTAESKQLTAVPLTPIGALLHGLTQQLAELNNRIQNQIQRLEI